MHVHCSKENVLFRLGMALTEKQGGSDVRANTTMAYCDNAEEKRYILVGHKYVKNNQTFSGCQRLY